MASNTDLNIRLLADVSKAERALAAVSTQLRNLNRQAGTSSGGGIGGMFSAVESQAGRLSRRMSTIANQATGGIRGLTGGLVAGGILGAPIAAAAFAINQAFDWQDAWMEVIKTVGSQAQSAGLDQVAFGLAKKTGMSPSEVARTMAIGGQMNVPTADLANFTEVMLKAGVATDMTSASAAQMAGQFAAAMREADPDKWNKILSTTAQLADALPGGETKIMDTADRFALAAKTIGLTTPQVLGLAAFTQGIGIEPEMGGSALSRLFLNLAEAGSSARGQTIADPSKITAASDRLEDIDAAVAIGNEAHSEMFTKRGKLKKGVSKATLMSADERMRQLQRDRKEAADALDDANHPGLKQAKVWADMAGMPVEDFGEKVKTDPMGTFRKLLGGLQGKDKNGSLIASLAPLGIDNIRDIQTLLPLVQGLGGTKEMPGLDDVMAMANGEFVNPSRLDKEFNTRAGFDVTKARQARSGVEVMGIEGGMGLGAAFAEGVTKLVQGADEIIKHLGDKPEPPSVNTVFNWNPGVVGANAAHDNAALIESVVSTVRDQLTQAWNAAAAGATAGEQLGGAFATP